jgi:hypothetical protein
LAPLTLVAAGVNPDAVVWNPVARPGQRHTTRLTAAGTTTTVRGV